MTTAAAPAPSLELLKTPVSPENADAVETIGARTEDVVLSVADHHGATCIEIEVTTCGRDDIGLRGATLEVSAEDPGEAAGKTEVLDDP